VPNTKAYINVYKNVPNTKAYINVYKNVPNTKAYINVYKHESDVPEEKMAVQLISGLPAVKLPQLPHNGHGNINTSTCTGLILSPTGFYTHGSVNRESNLITVQQDVTYLVYYISVGSSTYFGC